MNVHLLSHNSYWLKSQAAELGGVMCGVYYRSNLIRGSQAERLGNSGVMHYTKTGITSQACAEWQIIPREEHFLVLQCIWEKSFDLLQTALWCASRLYEHADWRTALSSCFACSTTCLSADKKEQILWSMLQPLFTSQGKDYYVHMCQQ